MEILKDCLFCTAVAPFVLASCKIVQIAKSGMSRRVLTKIGADGDFVPNLHAKQCSTKDHISKFFVYSFSESSIGCMRKLGCVILRHTLVRVASISKEHTNWGKSRSRCPSPFTAAQ